MNNFHVSVLLKEAIDYLNVEKNNKYIDATLGGSGHSFEILKHGGIVLGIDADSDAIKFVSRRWKIESRKWNIDEENLKIVQGNFRDIDKIARLASTQAKRARLNNFENVDGIIFDLGVSSYQIDTKDRGFSFQKTGPLDMRMDKNLSVKAADLINILTKGELYELFTKLGEEHRALAISDNIVRARRVKPIKTTEDLVSVIAQALGFEKGRISDKMKSKIASKVFQALRIAVNDELNSLREALPKAISLLSKNKRLVIIIFHSLEDRIVKESFKKFQKDGLGVILTKKVVIPSLSEVSQNRRARSAKMRVFERT